LRQVGKARREAMQISRVIEVKVRRQHFDGPREGTHHRCDIATPGPCRTKGAIVPR